MSDGNGDRYRSDPWGPLKADPWNWDIGDSNSEAWQAALAQSRRLREVERAAEAALRRARLEWGNRSETSSTE